MERKIFPSFATKIDTDRGVVEHIFAVLGNVDEGSDRLHSGSFSKTISERGRKVRVLDHHNTDSIMRAIGKPLSMREIRQDELPPDLLAKYPTATGGIKAETQFLMDTPEGKGAFIRIKEGAIDEWSFGYDALDVDYSKEIVDGKEMTIRNIRTLRLYEYSPVLWGMNPATATLSAKQKPDDGKPWDVFKRGDKWVVFKLDEDGKPVGEPLGEHDSEEEARQQVEALYANEKAVIRNESEDMETPGEDEGKATDGDMAGMMREMRQHCQAMIEMMDEMMGGGEEEHNKEDKTGRRVRRDKVELLRQLAEITRELMSWADYDDAEASDDEEMPKGKAGPGKPPTSHDLKRLIDIELHELDLYM